MEPQRLADPAGSSGRLRDERHDPRSVGPRVSPALAGSSLLLVVLGGGLQALANGTGDALLVAPALFLAGALLIGLLFPRGPEEMRAYLLTYGICLLAGGLAQLYSLAQFGNPQSTIDASLFLQLIAPEPPFNTMEELLRINAPLAVEIWQQAYRLAWSLGLHFGPYLGVMCNAVVMGLVGSLTVRIARELLGDDAQRLRRVGTLYASCGLFFLFGAVLLRDCFTTLLNVLVLWTIIRWLARPRLRRLVVALAVSGGAGYAMLYLRAEAVALFGLFWILALVCWYLRAPKGKTAVWAVVLAAGILLVAAPQLREFVRMSQKLQAFGLESYAEKVAESHAETSLGMRLVVNQPAPVRLILGSGAMLICPIPLWANFRTDWSDSAWIFGYYGIYQVVVLPLVLAGVLVAIGLFRKERRRAAPYLFLVVYLAGNLAAVVLTSMEQRHLAQFLPAAMILAVLPDPRDGKARITVRRLGFWWGLTVVFVHLAWAIMKGMA